MPLGSQIRKKDLCSLFLFKLLAQVCLEKLFRVYSSCGAENTRVDAALAHLSRYKGRESMREARKVPDT